MWHFKSFKGGITIHQAFGFNWTDGYKYEPLGDKKLAELRFYLSELKLIIIDEVSLLNCDMLYRIHMRLCEIFQSKAPFGKKCVIVVGDIMQVKYKFLEIMLQFFSIYFNIF